MPKELKKCHIANKHSVNANTVITTCQTFFYTPGVQEGTNAQPQGAYVLVRETDNNRHKAIFL